MSLCQRYSPLLRSLWSCCPPSYEEANFTEFMASRKRVHTTAASRLRQDYLRIVKDPVPYITALPLPSNILEWWVYLSFLGKIFFFSRTFLTQVFCSSCRHYVVRGPENSPYEGIKLMVWMWHWYIKKQCILLCPRLKHPCSASEWCHLLFKILNHWSLNTPRGNSHSKAIRACPAGWGKGFVPCKITNYQSLSLGFN